MHLPRILSAITAVLLFSCNQPATKTETTPDVLASNIDSTVKPGEDFFQYANGGWLKKNPMPADESNWSVGDLVQEEVYARLKTINEKAIAENNIHGTISQKISDFWQSGMDTASLEKQGLAPLQADLAMINKIASIDDIISATALLHKKRIGCLFTEFIAQDDKSSDVMAYQLYQGGLSMPNREYYFNTDAKTIAVRTALVKYFNKTFVQLGKDTATAAKIALSVLQLETKLAKASRRLADLRDPYGNYHKMDIVALQTLTPNFNWASYLKQIGINKLDSAIIGQPEFLTALNHELKSTSLEDWKNYLSIHLVFSSAPYLDTTTYNNFFEYRKTLSGVSKPRPRWKRVLDTEERSMGEALGQLFVKEYFNEKSKKRYNDLVEAIRDAFKERIQHLTWMSDSTKQKAIDKLSKVTKKVGYPNTWKDFSAMQIEKAPYVINLQKANEWWFNYNVNKLGKPVDRTEWGMTPQTYDAYYNPSNNEIVLPAAIFTVPGKKDEDLDDALVYGYVAASTIGHEITHGFDDLGRQYNGDGNLKEWWVPTDSVQFSKRASLIIKQFNEFMPVDTLHVNGEATQGENIADLGGVLLGLDAFKKTDAYKKGEKIAGFTPVQRYFLSFAFSWASDKRKEAIASQLMSDEHAPAKERVNGPVVNVPEFYEAFGIKPGDKMYRADSLRVRIW